MERKRTSFGIALEAQHDLGSTVPTGSDIFCHVTGVLLGINREASCETKVANLELTIGVDEQISWLQISVEDVGRVNIFKTAENLVNEGLEMGIGKRLAGTDNGSQIALHQLCRRVSKSSGWACRERFVDVN